ncbi:MAG: hypothetical protein SFV23_01050 [Planctomycetaceae bacterium]|nr:hypothetical protein [Planctomycetaceae bacterium]
MISFEEAVLILAPVAGLAVLSCGHLALCQIVRPRAGLRTLIAAFLAGFAVTLFLTTQAARSGGQHEGADLCGLVGLHGMTYVAFAYGYANFYNLGIASLRIRILQELLSAPHGLAQQELLNRYNGKRIAQSRLERLVQSHQIEFDGHRYVSQPSLLLRIAVLFRVLKRLILRRDFQFVRVPVVDQAPAPTVHQVEHAPTDSIAVSGGRP